jgi:hypothetical protein
VDKIRVGPWPEDAILRVYRREGKKLTPEQLIEEYAQARLLQEVVCDRLGIHALGSLTYARKLYDTDFTKPGRFPRIRIR